MESAEKDLVSLLNSGDKQELKAFLKLYTRPIYSRALAITGDTKHAHEVTKRVIVEIVHLASRGELREDIDTQLIELSDSIAESECAYADIVDTTVETIISRKPKTTPPIEAPPIQAAREAADSTKSTLSSFEAELAMVEDEIAYAAPVNAAGTVGSAIGLADVPHAERNARRTKKARTKKRDVDGGFDDDFDDDEYIVKRSPLLTVLIILLVATLAALIWMLVVKLMTLGVIPLYDFGFSEWFNGNIFRLY